MTTRAIRRSLGRPRGVENGFGEVEAIALCVAGDGFGAGDEPVVHDARSKASAAVKASSMGKRQYRRRAPRRDRLDGWPGYQADDRGVGSALVDPGDLDLFTGRMRMQGWAQIVGRGDVRPVYGHDHGVAGYPRIGCRA